MNCRTVFPMRNLSPWDSFLCLMYAPSMYVPLVLSRSFRMKAFSWNMIAACLRETRGSLSGTAAYLLLPITAYVFLIGYSMPAAYPSRIATEAWHDAGIPFVGRDRLSICVLKPPIIGSIGGSLR